jgi:hypothetical protein
MAKKKELCRDKRGMFVRNLGWKKTDQKYSQLKFYLGSDEAKAQIASLKLEQLWNAVCARWHAANLPQSRLKCDPRIQSVLTDAPTLDNPLATGSMSIMTVGVPELEYVQEGKPIWDPVSLAIADAIRNGECIARVPVPEPISKSGLISASVSDWLYHLRRDVPSIHIELRDLELNTTVEKEIHEDGQRLIAEGRRKTRQRAVALDTLHLAMEAYSKSLAATRQDLEGRVNANGNTQIRQVEFIKRHLADCPLADLTGKQIDVLQQVLRQRPETKNGTRSSIRSTKNYLKQFRAFLRWLDKTDELTWTLPPRFEFGQLGIQETAAEKSKQLRSSRVLTYTEQELTVLWEYASPLQRLFLLMGLNCGFGAKEIATLDIIDVHLRMKHPNERDVGAHSTDADSWILRLRNKTGVYGEWKLWPETVTAIDWWLRQRSEIKVADGSTTLMVTRTGNRYDKPSENNDRNVQIPNRWNALTSKIRKEEEHKEFRQLSFGKLRKTAGNFIRKDADGEVAGIFLCHGQPVRSDNLIDCYTNRPFAKVFQAIERVGQRLRPLWHSVEDPFPERRKLGGDNITLGTIKKIESMRKQGYKIEYIAEKLGISTETVRRRSQIRARLEAEKNV